jgi:hypothetical protein
MAQREEGRAAVEVAWAEATLTLSALHQCQQG